jgi:hypothetical protein
MHRFNYKIKKKPGRNSLRQLCNPYDLQGENHAIKKRNVLAAPADMVLLI